MFTIITTSIDGTQKQFFCESYAETLKIVSRLKDYPQKHFSTQVLREDNELIKI